MTDIDLIENLNKANAMGFKQGAVSFFIEILQYMEYKQIRAITASELQFCQNSLFKKKECSND